MLHSAHVVDKKNKLEEEVELCSVKLDRAQKLIGGLGGERARWSATAESLDEQYGALTGDALLGAATLSYFGAFTAQFRQRSIDIIATAIRAPPSLFTQRPYSEQTPTPGSPLVLSGYSEAFLCP